MDSLLSSDWMPYSCMQCGAAFCERVQIMNLALDYVDVQYCLSCLAAENEQPIEKLTGHIKGYIHSRECFETPWLSVPVRQCPNLKTNACYCQDLPFPSRLLDLRTTKCPLNFVKSKLALEKLAAGDILAIQIETGSQSTLNIPESLKKEGHEVVLTMDSLDGVQTLWIQKG